MRPRCLVVDPKLSDKAALRLPARTVNQLQAPGPIMSENPQPQKNSSFSVLLENQSGVMEVFLMRLPAENGAMFRAIGSIARSGELRSTDPRQLSDAVDLLRWANENQCVFEGQTSPQIESAN